jgi:hypothetical protein
MERAMNFLFNATPPVAAEILEKIGAESARAARWSRLSSGALISFVVLLLSGHVFSVPHLVVAAVPLAIGSAALHTMSMGCLGGVYWESLKALKTVPDYAGSGLHSRAKYGTLLGFVSQSAALLAVTLGQLALLFPMLWVGAFGMVALSLFTARYASRTRSLIISFRESSPSTGAVWL